MKPTFARIVLALSLLFLVSVPASATAPTLEPDGEFPASLLANHDYTFPLTYKQTEGDAPKTLKMIIDAPYGQVSQPAQIPGGNPTTGIPVTWNFTPPSSGQYQYHFEATSTTGSFARYPAGKGELEFESPSLIGKYVAMAIGLLVALLFLPFVVYVAARAINRRGDPSAAARVALMLGILASFALFWYLFIDIYRIIGVMIAGVTALAVLIVLLTRRRAA